MKIAPYLIIALLWLLTGCNTSRANFDYPTDIKDIKSVTLERPIESTRGEVLKIKRLDRNQIKTLLAVLQKAKPVGQVEFKPDFFISFETHVMGRSH
jgi:hypothetical protein